MSEASVLTCDCEHRPVLFKATSDHVLIRKKRGWWLIEGRVLAVKCGECGAIHDTTARSPP